MNEGSLNWSEFWAGAVEAPYQKPTVSRCELRWRNAAFACLSHVTFWSALTRRRGEKRRRRDAERRKMRGCHHITLQQAPYRLLEVFECHHCVSIKSQTFASVTSYRWTWVHKNVNTRREVSLFYQRLWLYLLQWRLSPPRLPFPGASVEGEGRECFSFLPWGVWTHLLITARKSLEVCASLGCLVQLHSRQPRNRTICCCAQRYRSKSPTPPYAQIYIPVQVSLLNGWFRYVRKNINMNEHNLN